MLDQITAPFLAVWEAIVEFFTLFPIWLEWLPLIAGIVLVCMVVGWFFESVRGFAGAVALASLTFLYGMAKGGSKTAERYKSKIEQLKQKNKEGQPTQTNPFDWWR